MDGVSMVLGFKMAGQQWAYTVSYNMTIKVFFWGNPCKLTVDRVFSQIINVGRLFFAYYGDAVI